MTTQPLTVLSDDDQAFLDTLQRFTDGEIAPRSARMDENERLDDDLLPKLFAQGLMSIQVDEQYGGWGGSLFQSVLAIEDVARVDPAVSVMIDVHNTIVLRAFDRWATDAQKRQYLPRLCTDTVGAFCLTEAGSGSDAFALKSTATADGDDWVINGEKQWITNAAEAGVFIVFANIAPESGHRGITAFLVDGENPGLIVGQREKKLGIRASSTCPVRLEDCRVPADAVLGEQGKGYRYAIELLNEGRVGIGAQQLGLARGAFASAFTYLHEREQFGKRIGDFQGVQFQYADLAAQIEASKVLVYNAARLAESGAPFVREAAIAKLIASETAQKVATAAVEFYGGLGFSAETDVSRFYRDVKIGTIYEGTSNMQRLTIARELRAAARC